MLRIIKTSDLKVFGLEFFRTLGFKLFRTLGYGAFGFDLFRV